jgi:tetratricopeptide (TPR) repeat protein
MIEERLSRPRSAIALLCLLTLSGYLGLLRAGFVYDDVWTIQNNSAIRSFDRVPDLFDGDAMADRVPDAWRPLMVISQMLDYRLFGLKPTGHHLHSLLWHLGCVLMVWLLVGRLFRRPALALTTAALFAIHPIHVETVSAINYREDLLASFFGLAALVALLAPLPGGPGGRGSGSEDPFRPTGRWTIAAVGLLATGLLAKATVAVLPVIYVVLRLGVATDGPGRAPVGRRLRAALPGMLALGAALALFIGWRLASAGEVVPYPATSTPQVPWPTHAEAFFRTVGQLLVPVGLSPEYIQPERPWTSAAAIASLLGILTLVIAACWAFARGATVEAIGLAWLLIAWIPTSGLLPLPNLRADRYAYLPSIGWCLLCAGLVGRIGRPALRRATVLALLGLLLAVTLAQVGVWRSEATVWARAVAVAPDSGRAWAGIARARASAGQLAEAERAAQRALDLSPSSGTIHLVCANILARRGKLERAIKHYARAEQLAVRHPGHLYASWGWALFLAGDSDAAEQRLRVAVARSPDLAQAHANLARLLIKSGRMVEARRALQRAVELAPERSSWRKLLKELK